jgi:hypothetical protein
VARKTTTQRREGDFSTLASGFAVSRKFSSHYPFSMVLPVLHGGLLALAASTMKVMS